MMDIPSTKTVLLFGASGATGSHIVTKLGLSNTKTLCIARSPLHINFESVSTLVRHDLSDIRDLNVSQAIGVICLGTTLKKAGSKKRFYEIDVELVVNLAKTLKDLGVNEIHVVSSMGANAQSNNYYLKAKGEMEDRLVALDFEHLTIYRPSLLIDGNRSEFRLGEILFAPILNAVSNFPGCASLKPLKVIDLANFVVSRIAKPVFNVKIYSSKEIFLNVEC